MKLRFWEPGPPPAVVAMGALSAVPLPARRMNLTELTTFCQAMCSIVGQPPTGFTVSNPIAPTQPELRAGMSLSALEGMLPSQRPQAWISARAPVDEGADPNTSRMFATLTLGDGGAHPAALSMVGPGVEQTTAPLLIQRWQELGRPRQTWAWAYPAGFLLAIVVVVAALVVGWVWGGLSLLTVPLAAGFVWLAFTVGARQLKDAVRGHRSRRLGLDIDWRLLDRVNLDRAARRQRWFTGLWSGAGGAIAGAVVTALLS